jgi:hypothetical protein
MVKISTNGKMHRLLIYQGYNGILLKTRAVQNTPTENPTLSAIFQLLNPAKNQLYSAGSSLMVAGGHSD